MPPNTHIKLYKIQIVKNVQCSNKLFPTLGAATPLLQLQYFFKLSCIYLHGDYIGNDNVDLGEVLSNLSKSGRLDKNDKRWVTQKLFEQQKHERNLQFLRTLETNQDLPFILMFLGGTAGAAILALRQKIKDAKTPEEKKTWEQQLAGITENILDYESFMLGGVFGWIGQELVIGGKLKELYQGDSAPKTWVDFAATTASSLSIGIATFGASILTLRAIFGNSSKDGGMASLAGLVGI